MSALLWLLLPLTGLATVPEKCESIPLPKSYQGRSQRDFMQNYYALASALSPLHGPIPHDSGRGAIGASFDAIPPLSCARRRGRRNIANDETPEFVDTYQDTNKSPVLPRLRATFAFPELGPVVPYGGVAYLPPVSLGGQRSVLLSAEVGGGMPIGDLFQLGLRFHATQQKTVSEIITPIREEDATFLDLFVASTFGLDLVAGIDVEPIVPYLSIGLTDASTYVYIGDDGQSPNNLHPYLGPAISTGLDGLVANRFRFGAEFYAAPGGYWTPSGNAGALGGFGHYGRLYTARLRLGVEL